MYEWAILYSAYLTFMALVGQLHKVQLVLLTVVTNDILILEIYNFNYYRAAVAQAALYSMRMAKLLR